MSTVSICLHQEGEPDKWDGSVAQAPRRRYVNVGNPADPMAFATDRYDLTHVKDGVAHYEWKERSVI